ncbi:deoxyuridine 5'-triphosphate nucleotidohydrolase [Tremella mesenterica]|uniref:Coronin n=1 Tax=Tremella mesenterica TaxID=5217 RepID=A0A4Q1BRW8_TREME|nr:uncharacterized protein TREMEDRAFT_37315 [Tremella mesenterica DSM 1558]EIW73401.1 hypothetical protein TREMEDRAFT_37315 [Tremella mesenterica DSM 1558]RXK40718.1 deoxyuridine 5'-triphosphate nucleotidohydrolase [Tremella mesenterica]
MSRFVRASKYRHVYGEKAKLSYENVKVSGNAWDTDLVTAGGKYLAINWQVSGGGAFGILPVFSPFTPPFPVGFSVRVPDILPLARGHTAPVLDTAWSPFDDNVVVSGGEDGKICVYKIGDELFEEWGEDHWRPEDVFPLARLSAGGRKVGQVVFHPTSSNVLASASGDHIIRVWDISKTDAQAPIQLSGHGDTIQSLAWNPTGTTMATTCRDKKLRLFDPRAGKEAVRVTDGHSGLKGTRVVWLGDRDRIATTGFSKMSDRQMGLWDTAGIRNIEMTSLDSSAGVLMPFFAEGNDILFLAGKGDGNIRYYEYENDTLHFLSEYKSTDPQRGMCLLPRRALEVNHNEIARSFKLVGEKIEPISWIVPRKAENFQSDIFPPAPSAEPAQTSAEYFAGKNARAKYIDLETRTISTSSEALSSPLGKPEKSQTAPASFSTPTLKAEPVKEIKSSQTSPVSLSIPAEPNTRAKDLEIVQADEPDSDDDVPPSAKHVSPVASTPISAEEAVVNVIPPPPEDTVVPPRDTLLVKKLSDRATVPTRGSALAAGYDLYSAEEKVIPARGKVLVDLQLSIAVPEGTYGRVAPRSGIASKYSIDTGAGVIDADYRGPVMVLLFNYSNEDFVIKQGDRIAQLILERICLAPIVEVTDLDVTSRGVGGFGSTGGFGK